jgi:hypothetical protein
MAIGKRANFDLIYSKYKAMGKGNVRLTQSSLFLTKDIDSTKSTYDFDVLENQTQTLQPDEIRLNINDEHIIQSLGVFLYGTYTKETEAGVVELGKQLFSYVPYELGYTTKTTEAPIRLKNLYAGTLKIAVNNIVYLEKWDTRRSEKVTRTQFTNHNAGIYDATSASNDFSIDGMVKFEPLIVLSGAKKNDITIRLPQAIQGGRFEWTNDADEVCVITIDKIAVRTFGLLAQNAAAFQ